MKNEILDRLVKSGSLKDYSIRTLDEDGLESANPGNGSRETEELTLVLPSGEVLVVGTFCSGCLENTSLIIG